MWRNDDCPCTQDCPERDPYCHGTCNKYKVWAAKRAKEKEAYAVQQERYMATSARKKALWKSYRRDHYGKTTKKFTG
jgi:hypothetical protein